jgi:hypothetical protein
MGCRIVHDNHLIRARELNEVAMTAGGRIRRRLKQSLISLDHTDNRAVI